MSLKRSRLWHSDADRKWQPILSWQACRSLTKRGGSFCFSTTELLFHNTSQNYKILHRVLESHSVWRCGRSKTWKLAGCKKIYMCACHHIWGTPGLSSICAMLFDHHLRVLLRSLGQLLKEWFLFDQFCFLSNCVKKPGETGSCATASREFSDENVCWRKLPSLFESAFGHQWKTMCKYVYIHNVCTTWIYSLFVNNDCFCCQASAWNTFVCHKVHFVQYSISQVPLSTLRSRKTFHHCKNGELALGVTSGNEPDSQLLGAEDYHEAWVELECDLFLWRLTSTSRLSNWRM